MSGSKNIKLLSILTIIIVLLLVIIAAEWGFMIKQRQQLQDDIADVSSSPYDVKALPTIALFKATLDDYSDMVNRPLFITGRRPIEIVVEKVVAAPVIIGEFEQLLIGVYGTEQGMSAIFKNPRARKDEPKYNKVLLGEVLAGWTVKEIHNDKVVLANAGTLKKAILYKPRKKIKNKAKPRLNRLKQKPNKQQKRNRPNN